jgi:hypothetical protein
MLILSGEVHHKNPVLTLAIFCGPSHRVARSKCSVTYTLSTLALVDFEIPEPLEEIEELLR